MKKTSLAQSALTALDPAGQDSLDAWREKILSLLLWTALVFGAATFVTTLPTWIERARWSMVFINGAGLAWLILITLVRQLPYAFRATSATLLLYVIGVAALTDNALSSSGRVLLMACAISAVLLLNLRAGLAAAVGGALTLGLVGWLMLTGRYPMPAVSELSNSLDPTAWLIAGLIFLFVNIILVLPLGWLYQTLSANLQTARAQSEVMGQQAGQTAGQLQARLAEAEQRLRWSQAAHDIAQLTEKDLTLEEKLYSACRQTAAAFERPHVALYRLDAAGRQAYRTALYSAGREPALFPETQPLPKADSAGAGLGAEDGSGEALWQAVRSRQAAVTRTTPPADASANIQTMPLAALPVLTEGQALGALVAAGPRSEFSSLELEALADCARQMGALLDERRGGDPAGAGFRVQAVNQALQASRWIAQAESTAEILRLVTDNLRTLPLVSAFFTVAGQQLNVVSMHDPEGRAPSFTHGMQPSGVHGYPEAMPLPAGLEQLFIEEPARTFWRVNKKSEAAPPLAQLAALPQRLFGADEIVFVPVMRHGRLFALVVLGGSPDEPLRMTELQPIQMLVELASTALEKVVTTERMNNRLAVLETLDTVSRAISLETDLRKLYALLHQQVQEVMGQVNFTIALYHPRTNTIEIAYSYDGAEFLQVPPFPLGQGLTSILLRTREPLMVVENAAERIAEMGAVIVGEPAKSWLGAPLLIAGEPIGALIVQDLEREHRFDENDQRLLVNLSGQVAAFIHNARLLEIARRQAERESQSYQITNKIRGSLDTREILEVTAGELAAALDARRVRVRLTPPTTAATAGWPAEASDQEAIV